VTSKARDKVRPGAKREINTTFRPGPDRQENHDEQDHDDSSIGSRRRAPFAPPRAAVGLLLAFRRQDHHEIAIV